jgi:DNA-binding transcriptional MerR regulator
MALGTYSISDLAGLTGIKTHTLRVWEKRYGLLKPQRTETNIRYYNDHDLETLRLIARLIGKGVRISKVAEMSPEEMQVELKKASALQDKTESILLQAIIDMNVTEMDSLLDGAIKEYGFEHTLLTLILPILEKMEIMWLEGTIDEAHETCFRELVKRKSIREIDSLPHNCQGPKVLMFLPHGNLQELNHHFMHYFLRKQGLCVTDMGCDINLDCACAALRKCESECVLIVNADPVHWQFGPFIKKLVERTRLPIIISGKAAEDDWSLYNGQVIAIDSLDETIRFVSRLKENLQDILT